VGTSNKNGYAMSLRVFRPSAFLANFVEAYWDYEDLTGMEGTALSILPDTATYLCFLYKDPLVTAHKNDAYRTRSGLAGFQSFRSDLGGSGTISGVSARLNRALDGPVARWYRSKPMS